MKIQDAINDLDREISFNERHIANLKSKKEKYFRIQTQYPDAQFSHNAIAINGIWNKITCMRIERKYDWRRNIIQIVVKFLVGKGQLIEGLKIYSQPYETIIAEIKWQRSMNGVHGVRNAREITTFDYKSIIPNECPRRKNFLKRLKIYLVNAITHENLTLMDNSFEKEEMMKLVLLR